MPKTDKNLDELQAQLEKEPVRKKKRHVQGAGFSKQKQVLEQSGYYVRAKAKKKKR